MGMIIKHLGYYDKMADMKYLAEIPADDIIKYYNDNYGSFQISNDDDERELNDNRELEILSFELTSDRKHLIVRYLPFAFDFITDEDVCDFFIDIYEVIGGLEKSYDMEEFIEYGFTKKEMEFADYLINRINTNYEESLLLFFDDFTADAFSFFLGAIKDVLNKDLYKHNFNEIVDEWIEFMPF